MSQASNNISCALTKAQISRLASVASGLSRDGESRAVKLDADAGTISVRGQEGDEAHIHSAFTVVGDHHFRFGVNLRFLRDQARATPVFRMHASTAIDPIVILCEDPDATFVLMPMRL